MVNVEHDNPSLRSGQEHRSIYLAFCLYIHVHVNKIDRACKYESDSKQTFTDRSEIFCCEFRTMKKNHAF